MRKPRGLGDLVRWRVETVWMQHWLNKWPCKCLICVEIPDLHRVYPQIGPEYSTLPRPASAISAKRGSKTSGKGGGGI